MPAYLSRSEIIDFDHPQVAQLAGQLKRQHPQTHALVRACFEWVRDRIKHSYDYQLNPVTCSASEVLQHGTGFCYAKSHLLAALLRANQIPCGFCYQRLSTFGGGAPYCLHGLNAVHLPEHGWYRLDPRGNKAGINAQFCPPVEQLAFEPTDPREASFPEIWPEPLPVVINALRSSADSEYLYRHLPDIEWMA